MNQEWEESNRLERMVWCGSEEFEESERRPYRNNPDQGLVIVVANEYLRKRGIIGEIIIDGIGERYKCIDKEYKENIQILEQYIQQYRQYGYRFLCHFIVEKAMYLKRIAVVDRGIPSWLRSTKFTKEKFHDHKEERGMIVISMPKTSELIDKGIKEGYRIVRINGYDVSNELFTEIQKKMLAAVSDIRDQYQLIFEEGMLSWFDLDGNGGGGDNSNSNNNNNNNNNSNGIIEYITVQHHNQMVLAPHLGGVHVIACWDITTKNNKKNNNNNNNNNMEIGNYNDSYIVTHINNKSVINESFEEVVSEYYRSTCPIQLILIKSIANNTPALGHNQSHSRSSSHHSRTNSNDITTTKIKTNVKTRKHHHHQQQQQQHIHHHSMDSGGMASLSDRDSAEESVSSDSDNNNDKDKDHDPNNDIIETPPEFKNTLESHPAFIEYITPALELEKNGMFENAVNLYWQGIQTFEHAISQLNNPHVKKQWKQELEEWKIRMNECRGKQLKLNI